MNTSAKKSPLGFTNKNKYHKDVLSMRSKVIHIRIYLSLVCVVLASPGYGQIKDESAAHFQESTPSVSCFGIGIGIGNQFSLGASFDILGELNNSKKTRLGTSLCYKGSIFNPVNEPADYEPGLFDLWFESSTMIAVLFAVEAPTGLEETDFGFALGPAYNSINEIIYTPNSNSGWLASNYDKEYNRSSQIGLLMNAKIKFQLTEKFGLEVSSFLNVNPHKSLAGVHLNLIFGRI